VTATPEPEWLNANLDAAEVLLDVDNVVKYFPVRGGALVTRTISQVRAVDGVSFQLKRGETLGLVGESGCGKSTLARLITALHPVDSGHIWFNGKDITTLSRRQMRPLRRSMQMVFQDPYGSLNPRMRVGSILGEPFAVHRTAGGEERKHRVQELMEVVGLSPEHYNRFPLEFSGGQRQRIGIARALALRPDLIVCDEPVSALDVSIQAQILNLLEDLQQDYGLTYIFIAHDLSVVRHVSDRVAVMYLGKLVEVGPVEEICRQARHPYTASLLSAVPGPEALFTGHRRERVILTGDVPSPLRPPSGCRFHQRCPKAQDICRVEEPPLEPKPGDSSGHLAACHFPVQAGELLAQAAWEMSVPERPVSSIDPTGSLPRRPFVSTNVAVPVGPGEPEAATDLGRGQETEGRTPLQLAWDRIRHDRVSMISLGFVVLLCLVAIFAPLLTAIIGHGPNTQYPNTGLQITGLPVAPGQSGFLLGTDDLGRDVLSRIIYGARVSLEVGVGATAMSLALGTVLGMFSGYYGGWIDAVLAQLMNILLSFPVLLFALALVARFGPSLLLVLLVVAFFSWPYIARLVRGQVISLREREFVESARELGAGDLRIMFVHIAPNLMALALVYATLLIPVNIVTEATLSYLGLGVQAPTASWGNMIAEVQNGDLYTTAWWFLVFPCLALFLTTLSFNLLGDGLRDVLDPRHGRKQI